MFDANPNYWEVFPNGLSAPETNAYRYEENPTIRHASQLTVVCLDIPDSRHVNVRQADCCSQVEVNCVWKGQESPGEDPSCLQRHDHYELIYVVMGKVKVRIEDAFLTFEQGEAFLLNRFTRNTILFQEKSELAALCMSAKYLEESGLSGIPAFRRRKMNQFFSVNIDNDIHENRDYIEFRRIPGAPDDDTVVTLFQSLYQELKKRRPGYLHIARGLVIRILMTFDDASRFDASYINLGASTANDLVEEIKSYMEQHPRRLERGDICEIFHYSLGYLSRLFKERTGMSLMKYNQKVHMEEARRLLSETNLSVSQIAARLGYVNRTQFYRRFREIFGVTPGEYREGARDKSP